MNCLQNRGKIPRSAQQTDCRGPRRSIQCYAGMRVRQVSILLLVLFAGLGCGVAGAADAEPIARVRARFAWQSGSWTITVFPTGELQIDRGRGVETRQIGKIELRELRLRLERELPWELPSQIGRNPTSEGPTRNVLVVLGTRKARFTLLSAPTGVDLETLRKDSGVLARAVRICEAIRDLARDASLKPCIE
jgi:hypothetical protein